MERGVPAVAGYDVTTLLGQGASSDVWLATERATGQQVALKLLRIESSAAIDRLEREATLLARVHHPHVLPIRSAVPTQDGLVLVLDYAAGGSLAQLLAARGRLPPGEVVTVAAPIAEALAHIHARGLVHADVSPGNVLLTADGRPLLADLGVARLGGRSPAPAWGTPGFIDPVVTSGGEVTPAADVYGLGAICRLALYGSPVSAEPAGPQRLAAADPLAVIVSRALADDPFKRPTAGEMRRLLLSSAVAPRPVRFPPARPVADRCADRRGPVGPDGRSAWREPLPVTEQISAPPPESVSAPGRDAPGRWLSRLRALPRPPHRVVALSAALVVLVATATVAGITWSRFAGRSSPAKLAAADMPQRLPTAAAVSPPPRVAAADAGDWMRILGELDARREAAFVSDRPDELSGVYATGSPALAADLATMARLRSAGLHPSGLTLHLQSVEVISRNGQKAQLRVTDVLSAYQLLDSVGHPVAKRPARGTATWLLAMRKDQGGWRISSVTRL